MILSPCSVFVKEEYSFKDRKYPDHSFESRKRIRPMRGATRRAASAYSAGGMAWQSSATGSANPTA